MNDFPPSIQINEEGPREGFQMERGPIETADKVRLIEALAATGVKEVQCVSFVNPSRVPGMADAEAVAAAIRRREGVRYTGIWLNLRGLERAVRTSLDVQASLKICASDAFSISNIGIDNDESLKQQRGVIEYCLSHGIPITSAVVMTAFGCNLEGDVPVPKVIESVSRVMALAEEFGVALPLLRLADTVGWANPNKVASVVGGVRERWPDLKLNLHLHDTRGSALANALMGLSMGVDSFDASCAGLGGCPFAGHAGAAGNVCTEDLAFMCEEMGIDTGIDLDALVECGRMAERIVGHDLPGKLLRGGTLGKWRH